MAMLSTPGKYPRCLLDLSIIGAIEINGVNRDAVGVPSNATIGGRKFGISDAVKAHDAVKAGIGLAESNSKVGDFCIVIPRQLKLFSVNYLIWE